MLERNQDCRPMDGEIIWCAATTPTKEKTTRKIICHILHLLTYLQVLVVLESH